MHIQQIRSSMAARSKFNFDGWINGNMEIVRTWSPVSTSFAKRGLFWPYLWARMDHRAVNCGVQCVGWLTALRRRIKGWFRWHYTLPIVFFLIVAFLSSNPHPHDAVCIRTKQKTSVDTHTHTHTHKLIAARFIIMILWVVSRMKSESNRERNCPLYSCTQCASRIDYISLLRLLVDL